MKVREERVSVSPFTFWTRSSGNGTPVVLVHGLSGSASWWRRNVEALAERHAVTAIDLVGFGRNRSFLRPGPLPLTFDDAAAMLVRWIERDFDQPVHLVGHSMGGQIAMKAAAFRPDLFRSLVLVNSTGVPFTLDPRPHVRSAMRKPPSGLLAFSRVVAFDFLRAGPTAVALATARILTGSAREAMTRVTLPTLLVWGDRDPLVPSQFAEKMRASIERSHLVVLPNAGHVAMWEAPERFNAEVLAFFESIDGEHSKRTSLPVVGGFNWGIAGSDEGVVYRAAGPSPSIILIHGLGVSSAYFRPLAHALHARGVIAAAPDLPGFGFSLELDVQPQRHHLAAIEWAERMGIRDAVWVGHSTGCQVVERVVAHRPELVRRPVFVSPIWSGHRHLFARVLAKLPADALLEEWPLVAIAAESYWNAGLIRLLRLAAEFVPDAQKPRHLPPHSLVIAGEHDPFTEWELFDRYGAEHVVRLPGGPHGVHFSQPGAVAEAILREVQR
jgi:pimeloyl-ACP methyl ester carboxylesterase